MEVILLILSICTADPMGKPVVCPNQAQERQYQYFVGEETNEVRMRCYAEGIRRTVLYFGVSKESDLYSYSVMLPILMAKKSTMLFSCNPPGALPWG